MTIKTIEYSVGVAGITPATEQFAGTQGDHRVVELDFILTDELYSAATKVASDGKLMYRFDVYDGEGGIWQSEAKELDDTNVCIELEERHTRYGGKVEVYLVITALSADGEIEVELYAFPATLRFKNRPEGEYQEGENYESVTGLVDVAKQKSVEATSSAEAAENIKKEMQDFAAEIEQKLKNGDFDGLGVKGAEIVNDELIITYTNGEVQNLGNVKGDKGDTGPQGEKGDAGKDGKDAVTDQTHNPKSENAQSGKAVAEAVSNLVPKKGLENPGAPFSSVLAVDNSYYSNGDINGNGFGIPIDNAYKYIDVHDVDYASKRVESASTYARMIPTRDENGNLWTGTPIDDEDCANKKYVDGLVGDIESLLGGI